MQSLTRLHASLVHSRCGFKAQQGPRFLTAETHADAMNPRFCASGPKCTLLQPPWRVTHLRRVRRWGRWHAGKHIVQAARLLLGGEDLVRVKRGLLAQRIHQPHWVRPVRDGLAACVRAHVIFVVARLPARSQTAAQPQHRIVCCSQCYAQVEAESAPRCEQSTKSCQVIQTMASAPGSHGMYS